MKRCRVTLEGLPNIKYLLHNRVDRICGWFDKNNEREGWRFLHEG